MIEWMAILVVFTLLFLAAWFAIMSISRGRDRKVFGEDIAREEARKDIASRIPPSTQQYPSQLYYDPRRQALYSRDYPEQHYRRL